MRPRMLVSFHSFRKADLADLVASVPGGVDLFADSGAFSAFASGASINLADYIAWLRHWAPLLTVAANLDVIGDPAASARNLAALTDANPGPPILPVFHSNTPWTVLERLCRDHSYVALGGLVAAKGSHAALMRHLVHCFRIARDHGTRFHGFGVTSSRIAAQLPFYSLDSSAYTYVTRVPPVVYLYDPAQLAVKRCSYRRGYLKELKPYAHLLPGHGLRYDVITRDDYCRPGDRHAADRGALLEASAIAFARLGQHLTTRYRVAAPAALDRHAVTGTKVYLAASDRTNFLAGTTGYQQVPAAYPAEYELADTQGAPSA